PRPPINFGTSLASIAAAFDTRMAEFQKIDGGTPDKFLALGAHVYNSCGDCLDRYLSRSGSKLGAQDRDGLDRIIGRLKRLADSYKEYLKTKPFPQFWA